ncbi:MAG TPA: N-acetylglucosamine-6-phosphate deacetylase [Ignavibacteriaceae bacterium]|nr:N-acetylglucosamine-6-phosphate deacetylase [Ignavibacteriaceae bacterium]
MEKLYLKNCRLFNRTETTVDIEIKNSTIKHIGYHLDSKNYEVIDCHNFLVSPGFIEVHLQGAGGSDILDGNIEALEKISHSLASLGTTSFLGTTVVTPEDNSKHITELKKYVNQKLSGAYLLGFHLEGPFINPSKKGGLSEKCIYPPSLEGIKEILKLSDSTVRMMTIAPELENSLEVIKYLKENNVIPSFAHSEADYKQTKKGFEAGINHVTHFFNAMKPLHHRNPGPLGAIFENENITAQVISDGHHLHPSIIRLIYKVLGSKRMILITDGMKSMGLPEGKYIYNGKEYISEGGAAKYPDGTLIGSTMSLGNIAYKFMEFTRCSIEEALNTITINPAKLLKIDDRKGCISVGHDADLVLLDNQFNCKAAIIGGEIKYNSLT